MAFGHWSTWAQNSAQRRARVALVARQRATARLAWVAWKARADWSAHQHELRSLAFQTWRAVTQQVAQLQSLFVRGNRRRAESAFMAWHQQATLARERSIWWVGARSQRTTRMVERCLREWRRLPRATPSSSDSSQGTSARLAVNPSMYLAGFDPPGDHRQRHYIFH